MNDVGLIFTLLDKAVRQFSLYGRQHPQSVTALKDLGQRLQDFFAANDRIVVTVKRGEFEYGGEVIFAVEKKENNYAQEMYIDGVREIEFTRDVSTQELADLISVLSRDVREYQSGEEDIVTLLWKKSFRSIRTKTVDVYAGDLNAMLREALSDEELSETEREERQFLDRFVERLVSGETTETQAPIPSAVFSDAIRKKIATPPSPIQFQISDETRQTLTNEANAATERNREGELLLVLSEVIEAQTDPSTIAPLLHSFIHQVLEFLLAGELKSACEWLKRLRGIQAFVTARSPDLQANFEEAIGEITSQANLGRISERVSRGMSATPDDWNLFFTYLGPGGIPAVCELLAHVSQETFHTTFCEYLSRSGSDRLDIYRENLKRPEWPLVRDMVRVLSSLLEGETLTKSLAHVAVHPQPEVRREVLKATSRFSSSAAFDFIKRGLKDPHESVRETALTIIGRSKDPAFAAPLAEIASLDTFAHREAAEKRKWLSALAKCGGTGGIEFLKKIALHGGSSDDEEEMRVAAVHAIASLNEPRANEVLRHIAGKIFLNRKVRETARQLASGRVKSTEVEDES